MSNSFDLVLGSFLSGTIVRVKLQRFVTYTAVEFHPGPHLNMVIGPNGTGKSSIVCAIALGLGWKPSVLGRAKDVAAYVKQGHDDATIELELKAKSEVGHNVILERTIYSKDNRSEWRLNGKKATATEIQAKVDEFNINVGNLCCFLPQDKVADFARMSPSDLLKETQKAAGEESMTKWHDKLIKYGRQQMDNSTKLNKEREEVGNLEDRNEVLHRDVRRAEERQKIEDDISMLKLRIPFARYAVAKERYDELKKVRNQRKAYLDLQKKRVAPLHTRLIEWEDRNVEMIQSIKAQQKTISKDTSKFKRLHEDLDAQESEGQKLAEQLSSVRNKELEGKRVIAQLSRKVAEMEEEVRDEPPRPDTSTYDARLRSIKADLRIHKAELAEAETILGDISSEMKILDHDSDKIRKELAQIDNVKNARLEILAKADRDVYQGVMWLRQNASRFHQKVYEPVLMELSVKETKYTAAVESCIPWPSQKTFICETRDDYDLLTRILLDEKGLRLNVIELEGTRSLHEFRKPTEEQELHAYGFEKYLIDCVDGPEAILQYLCSNQNFHAIPVTTNEKAVNAEVVEKSGKFQRFIAGLTSSTIVYSNYGSRLPQTTTRTIKQARSFVNSVDQTLRKRLEIRSQEIGETRAVLERRSQDTIEKENIANKRIDQLRSQQMALEQEKGDAQRPRSMWEKTIVNLNSAREALAHEKSKPTAEQQSRRLTAELSRVNRKSQEVIVQIMALMQQQVRLRAEVDEATLIQLQHQEKVNVLGTLKMEMESQFQEAQLALEDAAREFITHKAETFRLHKYAEELILSAPQSLVDRFNRETVDSANVSLAELEARLIEEQTKLEMMIEVRPGVMEEYNLRRRKIEELNETIRQLTKDKDRIDGRIRELEAKWVTALEHLVANVSQRFSRAFQAIGNAGEVRIAKHQDYDQWGIQIMVKFRDNEQLQQLTANRQSGGERSISTITYLLSLTEMSRSPFSLVDEINQGMDQKYERQVHNHMVNVTCREDAGQ